MNYVFTATINLPNDKEVNDKEYPPMSASEIMVRIVQEYPDATSVVLVASIPTN